MSLRTRLFCRLAAATRRGEISDRSLEQIQRERTAVLPNRFPLDRVFGSVPRDVTTTTRPATTRTGQVPVRVYEPAGRRVPSPLVVFFHGGGWVQGNVRSYDPLCAQVAHRLGALVVSVDYRLAPEHPFPAAVHDAYDATCWAVENAASLGVDPRRVAVMGDSAGGNLAAVVSLLARDEGGPTIAFQALIYPATDATWSSPSMQTNANAPILTSRNVHDFMARYRGDADVTDPLLSPLLAASHAGLPPALIQTAELDPLLDDGRRYADALGSAGVPVRYTEYVGVPHGFASFPGAVPNGRQSLAELVSSLRAALAEPDGVGTARSASHGAAR